MLIFYFLVMLMPLEQHPLWGKFVGGGTVVKWIGLACFVYAVCHLVSQNTRHRYFLTPQARIYLLYLPLVSASYWLMGPEFSLHNSEFIIYVSMSVLFFIVVSTVDTLDRLRWTLLTAVASLGLTSAYVFREWMRDPWWRPGSISGDANYFSLNAALVLPIALLFMLRSKKLWERILALGCLLATFVSTTLGASRGGMVALMAAFLLLIWHSPRRVRNLVVITVLFIPPLVIMPSSPLRRFMHPKYSDLNGKRARLIAWRAALHMIEAHPLVGIGVGQFKPKMLSYAEPGLTKSSIAHNTYLEVASEAGLPTFCVFLALLFLTYRSFNQVRLRALKDGRGFLYLAAFGMQAGFFGYVVGAFFLSAEYQKLLWLWIFLSMVLASFASSPFEAESEASYALPRLGLIAAGTGNWRDQDRVAVEGGGRLRDREPGRSGREGQRPSSVQPVLPRR